jgi:hypothetical protein
MTLDEIAYNLLNLLRGGRSSNDENISLDQIKFNIQHYRAMLIRRDYARNGVVSKTLEQDLGCIPLVKVDANKCCDLNSDCPVYRTNVKMPKPVRFNLQDAFTFIGKPNGTSAIPRVEPYMVDYLVYDKYNKDKSRYYVIDEYIYVYNPNGLENVNVRGVFEDPREVHNFNTCTSGNCFDPQSDYPLPADMLSQINMGLLQGELQLLSSTFPDSELNRQQDKQ